MLDIRPALDAARSIASELGLATDDAIVLQNSNKLALRLLPCDVMARVAHVGQEIAQFEVELAQLLANTESPFAELEPRVPPRVYERDGFAITLWTYYETVATGDIPPADYANALARMHAGMRGLDAVTTHFTDRGRGSARACRTSRSHAGTRRRRPGASQQCVARFDRRDQTAQCARTGPPRRAASRATCSTRAPGCASSISRHVVRGPVEFDLVHTPEAVQACYPGANQQVLRESAHLVLAMVAAWRFDLDDQLPNGLQAGEELLRALRVGPPWQSLDAVFRRAGAA